MVKVSIIVPTYNVEPYLVESMESIINQTLKDIEIICINDGSTDGSLEILKRYAEQDARIRLVDKENGGYGVGVNIGMDMATGEYIGIVEPDDFVPVNMFGDLYEIAAKNNLDWVKADFYRFMREPNGDMFCEYNQLDKTNKYYNKVFDPSNTPEAIHFIMNTWSGIYKRTFLNEFNIRHNETPGASFRDNGFWFQTFAFAKRGMIVDKPYYMNRRDNPNSSVCNKQKVYCINVEYDHIKDILMQYPEIWEKFKMYYTHKRYHNGVATFNRIADEFKQEYVHRFSKEMKRAKDLGELDESVFYFDERKVLDMLLNNTEAFCKFYSNAGRGNAYVGIFGRRLEEEIKQKESEIEKIEAELEKSKKTSEQLKSELDRINRSKTFRLGKLIMYVPVRLKGFLRRNAQNS